MISTTVITTTVIPSPDDDVTIAANIPPETTVVVQDSSTVTIATVETPALILTSDPATTTVTVTASTVEVLPTSDDVVDVNVSPNESVTINTTDSPVQISSSTPATIDISVTTETDVVVNTPTPSVVEIATVPANPVTITIDTEITNTIEAAYQQGPAGPRGIQGPPGGTSSYAADVIISGHVVVRATSTGGISPASCTDLSNLGTIVGITDQSYMAGSIVSPITTGTIEHSGWSFITGQKVFLGIDGTIVQPLPVGALFLQSVGIMLSSTRLLVNIESPIVIME